MVLSLPRLSQLCRQFGEFGAFLLGGYRTNFTGEPAPELRRIWLIEIGYAPGLLIHLALIPPVTTSETKPALISYDPNARIYPSLGVKCLTGIDGMGAPAMVSPGAFFARVADRSDRIVASR